MTKEEWELRRIKNKNKFNVGDKVRLIYVGINPVNTFSIPKDMHKYLNKVLSVIDKYPSSDVIRVEALNKVTIELNIARFDFAYSNYPKKLLGE